MFCLITTLLFDHYSSSNVTDAKCQRWEPLYFDIFQFESLHFLVVILYIKIEGGFNSKKYERTPKISNWYSYFFVFFANRRKNRHIIKTRRRQYIFVTDLKLAPYIVAKTSILGVKHHTTYIKVSK